MKKEQYTFDDFKKIMETLRGEGGCPWDRKQTHESLAKYLLEESYEVVDAIENKNMENLCEELGDVLLQVVFHGQIGKEAGEFTLEDVIDRVSRKMILRHPHIFAEGKADTPEEVLDKWEEIKKKEKNYITQTEVLKSVPKAMPPLMRAEKVQAKAAVTGFDFSTKKEVLDKFSEEVEELKKAVLEENGNMEEELGDILFSTVNLSRFLKINPSFALTKSTEKFINRFEHIEKAVLSRNLRMEDMDQKSLDFFWEEAKHRQY